MEEKHVSRLDDDAVRRHDLLEPGAADSLPGVTEVVGQIHQHAAALHAVEGHVLETEMVREGPVRAAVATSVGDRTNEVDPGPVAVVVHGLVDPVTIGVELGSDMGERVPLR